VPRQATLDFGVDPDDVRTLAANKGGRDAAVAPMFDATSVLTNGGKLAKAIGVHGAAAALLLAAGLILALGGGHLATERSKASARAMILCRPRRGDTDER
jgi:thiosulfate reductase cytochrome b subunit